MVARTGTRLAAALAATRGGPAALAQDPPHPDGGALSRGCTSCHGLSTEPVGAIPAIWGRDASELEALMAGFRDGTMEGTVMPRLMRDYTPEEVAALAAFLAERRPEAMP